MKPMESFKVDTFFTGSVQDTHEYPKQPNFICLVLITLKTATKISLRTVSQSKAKY